MKPAFGLLLAFASAASAVPRSPIVAGDAAETTVAYTVQKGDSLHSIGRRGFRNAAGVVTAQRLNHVANPRHLRLGSTLVLPLTLLRLEPGTASVLTFRGSVALASGGATRQATTGAPIAEGDFVATGSDGFVTIGLSDGSRVSLPSRSRLRVAALHRVVLTDTIVRQFALVEGQLETAVQPVGAARNRFEVSTPVSVAAVRGTKFRVTFDPAATSSGTGVVGGAVSVSGAGGAVDLPTGQGVIADRAGPGTPVPLLAAPTLAAPDRLQDERMVDFALVPLAGAARYRAKLATDSGFVDVIGDATALSPRVTFADVANGSYLVRLAAMSPDGLEGLSRDYTFDRQLNVVATSVTPPNNCPARRCLRFSWIPEGAGERRFHFQLRRSPDTLPLVDLADLVVTELVPTDPPGGDFLWRVESSVVDKGRRATKWSDYQALHIAAPSRR